MLDQLGPHLSDQKTLDLLRRVENKRIEQALPAEAELSLLWGLSTLGDLDIEPHWWGDRRRPEAYTEHLIPGRSTVIEVLAVHDATISGQAAMDGIALQMSECANRARRGVGAYLYFMFSEESGYEQGRYFRRRLAPKDYVLTESAAHRIREWVVAGRSDQSPLVIDEPGLRVQITQRAHRQIRFHNCFSSMPPEVYSIDENPLYDSLRRKLPQLAAASAGTVRLIFLMDAGSHLLNRLGQHGENDPLRRRYSGTQILHHFINEYRERVDAVVAFVPSREDRYKARSNLRWNIVVVSSPDFRLPENRFSELLNALPRPRFEGYQVRSLFLQRTFATSARGWYRGMEISSYRSGPMKVKMSSRALLDLLAGRLTPEQFRHQIGQRPGEKNLFQHWLDMGKTISAAELEPGGLDQDDDYLLLTLSDDPAAKELAVKPRPRVDEKKGN
jgi:hypothetical protein